MISIRVSVKGESAVVGVISWYFAGVDEIGRGIDAVMLWELYFFSPMFFFELMVRVKG